MHARLTFSLLATLTLADAQGPAAAVIVPAPDLGVASPKLSPADVAQLETKVAAAPTDTASRLQLLRHYQIDWITQISTNPATRAARLRHILYLIENQPAEPALADPLAYVPSQQGPYADAGDHELIRNAWHRAASSHPTQLDVQLQAARILYREHPEEAEDFLSRVLDREPADRKVAATLGFFYALDVLRPYGWVGTNSTNVASERERIATRAKQELERTRNPVVLAAAGTALPSFSLRTEAVFTPTLRQSINEFSTALLSRSRQLVPANQALQGPDSLVQELISFHRTLDTRPVTRTSTSGPKVMPMFRYEGFTQLGSTMQVQGSSLVGIIGSAPSDSPNPSTLPPTLSRPVPPVPTEVSTKGAVRAAKLIAKSEPVYPPLAMQARIQGVVRLKVLIAADGKVGDINVIAGHRLLQQAAIQAVRTYRYEPAILNGDPVAVTILVDVPFLLPQ